MIVSWLSFLRYCNLREGEFLPDPRMNVIFGRNAQGKTNLPEALWLFAGGRSFHGSRDSEPIALKQDTTRLQVGSFGEECDQNAVLTIQNKKRSATINGVQYGGIMELMGKFRAVIFSSEHLSLVKDDLALRHSSLGDALYQLRPVYAKLLFQYNRVLQQKSTLLKDIPCHAKLLDTPEIWDGKLAQRDTRLIMERSGYVHLLSEPARRVYEKISGARERFSICYRTVSSEEPQIEEQWHQYLFDLLGRSRGEDFSVSFTTAGPHRDDLEVRMDERQARSFDSQDQQYSCVLTLKLAEAELLQTLPREAPVVLLDDMMNKLDSGRQNFLLHRLGEKQVFLTCCDPETTAHYSDGGEFEMEQGWLTARQ